MSRSDLDPLGALEIAELPASPDRVAWLHACFAPAESLIDTETGLRRELFAGLAAELRRLTGHVEELHFLDLPGRLASRLVRLAREQRPGATGEVRLDWPYTQSDLAAMIGGTRQTVNRLLSDLVAQGLIRLDRDSLVIPDIERLARAAER
jgi:CRP/FNR family transcriptional regulator